MRVLEQLEVVGVRHRERVVRGDRAAVVVEPLEQREVDDPQELQPALVHRRPAEVEAQRAEHVVDEARRAGDDQHEVARLRRRARRPARAARLSVRNFATGDSSAPSLARPASTPARPRRAAWPGRRACRPGARDIAPSPGTRMPFTHAAWNARNSVAANTSLRSTSSSPKRTSGLSRAVALHRLVPRHPVDRRRGASPVTASAASSTAVADHAHARRRVGEAHLGVELHELELAVGAQVLVAQAARDLVVAVEAADHQQLLEQLRALRQRVERRPAQPRRHDEVARAFGRRRDQHRRLDLDEALRVERRARIAAFTRARMRRLRCIRGRRRSR